MQDIRDRTHNSRPQTQVRDDQLGRIGNDPVNATYDWVQEQIR